MHLRRTDLFNLIDTVFILVHSYLIQLFLHSAQMCEKTQKSSIKVRAGTKLLIGDAPAQRIQ